MATCSTGSGLYARQAAAKASLSGQVCHRKRRGGLLRCASPSSTRYQSLQVLSGRCEFDLLINSLQSTPLRSCETVMIFALGEKVFQPRPLALGSGTAPSLACCTNRVAGTCNRSLFTTPLLAIEVSCLSYPDRHLLRFLVAYWNKGHDTALQNLHQKGAVPIAEIHRQLTRAICKPVEHLNSSFPLCGACRLRSHRIIDDAALNVCHVVPKISQVGALLLALAVQPGLWIGGRLVSVVTELLAVPVRVATLVFAPWSTARLNPQLGCSGRLAPRLQRRSALCRRLGNFNLQRRRDLLQRDRGSVGQDLRAVNTKSARRGDPDRFASSYRLVKQRLPYPTVDPLFGPQFDQCGLVWNLIIEREAAEPAKTSVHLHLVAKFALRTTMQSHEYPHANNDFRIYRASANTRIERFDALLDERKIENRLQSAQSMVRRNQHLHRYKLKQFRIVTLLAKHRNTPRVMDRSYGKIRVQCENSLLTG